MTTIGRRDALALGAATMLGRLLWACVGGSGSGEASGDDAGEAGTDDAVGTLIDAETEGGAWASGGTAAMTAKATYPNPFTDLPATCTATCELTEGPCYSSQSVAIQDISYGYAGLPMRMMLRVLDENCKPVSGAVVDVWHVGPTGKYSGDDTAHENVAFCTGNDADFTSHVYFRGKQTTDESGVVFFDTCFPGWYAGRTIHVHMTITVGGQAYVTTQLGFADTLDDEIVSTEPIYKDRGARDTTNTSDTVLPATGVEAYLFDTQKMTDGAMLAWKTLILRKSLGESVCSPAGAGGPPGGGGPPPDAAPP
jgi:protocatechuate 3,4-dioxygenase beta subunit